MIQKHIWQNLAITGTLLMLLIGCGVSDQPTAGRPADDGASATLGPSTTLTTSAFSPKPRLDAWGNTIAPADATLYAGMNLTLTAQIATMEARRIAGEATALASGPSSPIPIPTDEPGPTKVPRHMTPVSSGYIFSYNSPSKLPVIKNAWIGDLSDGRQVLVLAGGYHSLLPSDTTPAVGWLGINIKLPPTSRDVPAPYASSEEDPRVDRVILPVTDGYARVLDARMTATEILVFVRTEGGSTYSYEVNSHTLTQTGGPTATPLPPGAPTPTIPVSGL